MARPKKWDEDLTFRSVALQRTTWKNLDILRGEMSRTEFLELLINSREINEVKKAIEDKYEEKLNEVLKQKENLEDEISKLKKENEDLRNEINSLSSKNKELQSGDILNLKKELEYYKGLVKRQSEQQMRNAIELFQLKKEYEKLRKQIEENGRNSLTKEEDVLSASMGVGNDG